MAKAAQITLREKPYTITLPPSAFSTRWNGRPKEPYPVGLRVASAEERILASTEATARTDRLLPDIVRRSGDRTQDPSWAATYEVCWIHYLLGYVLCSPRDTNAPLWAAQDGTLMLFDTESPAPGDAAVTSSRFSDEGIARLWDEYDALCIRQSPVWPEATPEELSRLGARLADGSFFAALDAAKDDPDAAHVAAQLRRLAHYMIHLRASGRERATE